jgi:hypothetical protein
MSKLLLDFFQIEDIDELEDAFETYFFTEKQFFIRKVPVRKLVESRSKKLQKANNLYLEHTQEVNKNKTIKPIEFSFELSNLGELFQEFNRVKADYFSLFYQCKSVEEYLQYLNHFCQFYYAFAGKFTIELNTDEHILVSQEKDPMELLHAIREYEAKGGKSLIQLKNLENEPPEMLIHEMKRLSLLFNSF